MCSEWLIFWIVFCFQPLKKMRFFFSRQCFSTWQKIPSPKVRPQHMKVWWRVFQNFLKTDIPRSKSLSSTIEAIFVQTMKRFNDDWRGRDRKKVRQNVNRYNSNSGRIQTLFLKTGPVSTVASPARFTRGDTRCHTKVRLCYNVSFFKADLSPVRRWRRKHSL